MILTCSWSRNREIRAGETCINLSVETTGVSKTITSKGAKWYYAPGWSHDSCQHLNFSFDLIPGPHVALCELGAQLPVCPITEHELEFFYSKGTQILFLGAI